MGSLCASRHGKYVLDVLMCYYADLFVHLAADICEIVSEYDSSNDNGETIAPVLPHKLISSDIRQLFQSIEQHDSLLKYCLS